jgi:DNA-directed RNA polymerase I, II, and III subunit RPABC1
MHELQPKHSKLNKEEAKKLLEKLNISLSQLPKISLEDPAIINNNFQTGDIVKIERKTEESEEEFFRVVVK